MEKVHIDEVYPQSPCNMIVNFQNGYPSFTSKKCSLYQDNNSGDKTIFTEIADLLYSGVPQKSELTKTVILARNKITGKVRLIAMSTADMKPVLKTVVDDSAPMNTSYLELTRKFGSKKTKKRVEQREKFKANQETVSEQMHNVTVNMGSDELDLSTYLAKDSDDFYIPPIDRAATKVEELYDIYRILTQEQYDQIYSELENKDYLSEIVPWMKHLISKDMKKERMVLAVYTSCLINLYFTNTRDIMKKNFVSCQYSATLNDIILKNFTVIVNNRRNRSLQLKGKGICHAIVFLLILNNYKYECEELSKNLKIAMRTLSNKVRLTGAVIVTVKDKKFIHLKLPLPIGHGRRKSAKF